MRIVVLTACLFALGSCSSNELPDLEAPNIVGAAFVGAGSSPVAGDTLVLVMNRDVQTTGATLTDADFVLSSGTLGTSAFIGLIDSRSVQLTLGTGVTFAPGTTTIALSTANDVIRTPAGYIGGGGAGMTISVGDGDHPTISNITAEAIEDEYNGDGAAGGVLQVPTNGFSLDVTASDATSALDPAAFLVSSDLSVETPLGALPPGTDISGFLTVTTVGSTTSFFFPPAVVLPDTITYVSVVAVDVSGMASTPTRFKIKGKKISDPVRPFETPQLWYLDLTRDLESYTVDLMASQPVAVVAGANLRTDLEDLFFVVGLYGSNSSVNFEVMTQFRAELLRRINEIYDSVDVSFTFTSPGVFPGGATTSSVFYAELGWSQMCIGGAANADGTLSSLGYAIVDPNNDTQNNNCLLNFDGRRLGVFLHTCVNSEIGGMASDPWRQTFDGLLPARGGTPIGDDASDAGRLAGTVTDGRATTISNAILRMARSLAFVTAHECGHSMGLVWDGAMPAGLYGGDATNFPGSTAKHIETAYQFSGDAVNIMGPSGAFVNTMDLGSAFNRLNLAYLRERVLYDKP